MMIVDASAIVALMRDDVGADALAERLDGAAGALTHAVSVYEAALAIVRTKECSPYQAYRDVADFLHRAGIGVLPLDSSHAVAALEAFSRYGKGRKHPAQLNMGDCFSYACAKLRGMPLLSKGEDFARTDLAQTDLA